MALLARLADHFEGIAGILREVAGTAPVPLDESATSSPGVGVETAPETRPFVTVGQLAERLQIDPKTVRRWREEHRLPPAMTVGGVVRWRAEVIDEWIAAQEEAP